MYNIRRSWIPNHASVDWYASTPSIHHIISWLQQYVQQRYHTSVLVHEYTRRRQRLFCYSYEVGMPTSNNLCLSICPRSPRRNGSDVNVQAASYHPWPAGTPLSYYTKYYYTVMRVTRHNDRDTHTMPGRVPVCIFVVSYTSICSGRRSLRCLSVSR